MNPKHLNTIRERRIGRIRSKIHGTKERPRLSIFRSNQHIHLQLINDDEGKTLISLSSLGLKGHGKGMKKSDQAAELGKTLAEKAKAAGITAAILDRGSYRYHGRVKAIAEAARKTGLKI